MKLSEAIADVLGLTGHDTADTEVNGEGDGHVTTRQITRWIVQRYIQIRRLLADKVPALYVSTTPQVSFTTGQNPVIDKPSDFERTVRVELLPAGSQSNNTLNVWTPVRVSDGYAPELDEINYREEGTQIILAPTLGAQDGTLFRLVYNSVPAADMEPDDDINLPPGMEDCVTEWVSARVRSRGMEDNGPHFQLATSLLTEQLRALARRYKQPKPGLRRVRGAW